MKVSLDSSCRELNPCNGMRDDVGSEGQLFFDITGKDIRNGQGRTVDQKVNI